MRLLYVALTRSREKLIITGVDKNLKESIETKMEMLQASDGKITKTIAKKAKSYLDWLEEVYLSDDKIKEIIDVYEHKKNENLSAKTLENKEQIIEIEKREANPKINEILTWEYPYKDLTKIEGKSSVSKLSKKIENAETNFEIKKPRFLVGELPLSKAEIGTVVHLIIQKLDFRQNYTMKEIEDLLEKLEQKEIITTKQKQAIPKQEIQKFTNSDLFKEISEAKEIYKEQPFYLNIPVKELYESDSEESILVQGIIDLYYITKEGQVILVDYKTDYVLEGNEDYLKEKYTPQLKLYKRAIEHALNKQVDKTFIYSTYLSKKIEVL